MHHYMGTEERVYCLLEGEQLQQNQKVKKTFFYHLSKRSQKYKDVVVVPVFSNFLMLSFQMPICAKIGQ